MNYWLQSLSPTWKTVTGRFTRWLSFCAVGDWRRGWADGRVPVRRGPPQAARTQTGLCQAPRPSRKEGTQAPYQGSGRDHPGQLKAQRQHLGPTDMKQSGREVKSGFICCCLSSKTNVLSAHAISRTAAVQHIPTCLCGLMFPPPCWASNSPRVLYQHRL